MAVLMTLDVPGGTTAKYERVNELLGFADARDAPPGLISHVCGTSDDGIVVVDVWDSLATLDEFARNRLGAALEKAEMPPAEPQTSPVHNMLFGAGKDAGVIVLIDMPGFTTAAYDAIVAKLQAHVGNGDNHPAVMHVAALEPDGHLRVADLWASAAAFTEFAQGELAAAAGDGLPPIEPRILPVHNRLEARPADA